MDDQRKLRAWVGVVVVLLVIAAVILIRKRKEDQQEKALRDRYIIVDGTVLAAGCPLDPTGNSMKCGELVVRYNDTDDQLHIRSFNQPILNSQLTVVPQIGSRVLVSYDREDPEQAIVAPVEE